MSSVWQEYLREAFIYSGVADTILIILGLFSPDRYLGFMLQDILWLVSHVAIFLAFPFFVLKRATENKMLAFLSMFVVLLLSQGLLGYLLFAQIQVQGRSVNEVPISIYLAIYIIVIGGLSIRKLAKTIQ